MDGIFPDLIECGVDVFNPFQPEVMDVFEIKRTLRRSAELLRRHQHAAPLPYGTPQQVRDEVRRLLDEIGRDGGYIAAPGAQRPGDARPENIAAMIEVLQGQ